MAYGSVAFRGISSQRTPRSWPQPPLWSKQITAKIPERGLPKNTSTTTLVIDEIREINARDHSDPVQDKDRTLEIFNKHFKFTYQAAFPY